MKTLKLVAAYFLAFMIPSGIFAIGLLPLVIVLLVSYASQYEYPKNKDAFALACGFGIIPLMFGIAVWHSIL